MSIGPLNMPAAAAAVPLVQTQRAVQRAAAEDAAEALDAETADRAQRASGIAAPDGQDHEPEGRAGSQRPEWHAPDRPPGGQQASAADPQGKEGQPLPPGGLLDVTG